MMGSPKRQLTIGLTVVSLLAMVGPAAIAEPQSLQGIQITAPTNAGPAHLTKPDAKVGVEFNILTQGAQECDVRVKVRIFDQNGYEAGPPQVFDYAVENLQGAVNEQSESLDISYLIDGWYNLVAEAEEGHWKHLPPYVVECGGYVFTDTEEMAFLLDRVAPMAKLVKPAANDWKGATFVTGKDFLLVGTAEDESGIKDTWFELCPGGESACLQDWDSAPGDDNWRAIGDVPAEETPGIPGQYQVEWDSTTVPDGFYFIRICAEDNAGNGNCWDSREDLPLVSEDGSEHFNPWPDAHWVYVNNRVACPLAEGWNLSSTPLMPYDTDIEDVLADLVAHGTVESVWTMVYQGGKRVWKVWTPTAGPVDTLTNIVDGQGYWIKMKAPDTWNILGTWTTIGSGKTPPAYPVYAGCNLVGYTHWGRPTVWPTDEVGDYLGALWLGGEWPDGTLMLEFNPPADVWPPVWPPVEPPVWPPVEPPVWRKVYPADNMGLCKAYWLCGVEGGVIRF